MSSGSKGLFALLSSIYILIITFKVKGHEYCNADSAQESLMTECGDECRSSFDREQIVASKVERQMEATNNHGYLKYGSNGRRRLVDISIPIVKIPVVFHVLYESQQENLSEQQLESAIKVLNEDFRGNSDIILNNEFDDLWASRIADTRIEFYIAGIVRKDVTNARITQGFLCTDRAKQSIYGGSDSWDPYTYANVWICRLTQDTGGYGYAYFPCLLDTISYQYGDGVVMEVGIVGNIQDDINGTFYFRNDILGTLDTGKVLVHEFGHYLNLYHIWGITSECGDHGDYVSDTPDQSSATAFYCPTFDKNTCNEIDPETGVDLRDMYENPMDYAIDACRLIFTERQAWRMRATLGEFGCRSQMYENGKYYDCSQELGLCENSPCNQDEAGACIHYQSGQGCSQCGSGYFKMSVDHSCVSCSDIFGDGCMFCQDGIGCGQCKSGYTRNYLSGCNVYVCKETGIGAEFSCDMDTAQWHILEDGRSIKPCNTDSDDDTIPCDCDQVCHCTNCFDGQGCAQCENGYFKKSNGYPCISCNEYYGDRCLFCQDNIGCGQCRDGCHRYINNITGLWDCECTHDYCPDNTFCCINRDCEIPLSWQNDGWCDCGLCEDEDEYSCTSCSGWADDIVCVEPDHCGTRFIPCGPNLNA